MLVVGDNAPAEDGVVSEGVCPDLGGRDSKREGLWLILDPALETSGTGTERWAPHPFPHHLAMHHRLAQPPVIQMREAWRPGELGLGPGHLGAPLPSHRTAPR